MHAVLFCLGLNKISTGFFFHLQARDMLQKQLVHGENLPIDMSPYSFIVLLLANKSNSGNFQLLARA
jgi:hypothetical protein